MTPRVDMNMSWLQVRAVETGSVALSQVVTEQQLVEHSESFEHAIAGKDRAALQVRGVRLDCA